MKDINEKVLFADCFSGISGDMFISALLDAGADEKTFVKKVSGILPSNVQIKIWNVKRGGFTGKRFKIETSKNERKVRHLKDIKKILKESNLEKKIIKKSSEMFEDLATVEAETHGVGKEEIHFHELGAIDSIADIVGAVIAVDLLNIKKIYFSKINTGTGFTEIAHGRVPLPAPATAKLLKGSQAPIYSTGINSELVTPTGALIIKHLGNSFQMPEMRIQNIGIGFGSKEFKENPNFLRAMVGTRAKEYSNDEVLIETNIDDMNPEFFPSVEEKLMDNGALDVFSNSIQMKKGRTGLKLSIICKNKNINILTDILFRETSTIGIRIFSIQRRKLRRETKRIETQYGKAKVKLGFLNGELVNIAPEFSNCEKLATDNKIPVKEIYETIKETAKNLLKSRKKVSRKNN